MRKGICFLIAACGLCAAAASGLAGQTKVKTVDGVQVLTLPKKPAPPQDAATKLVLEEQFAIGQGTTPEDTFAEVFAFDIDEPGQKIFVLDRKENLVKVFDVSGKFLFKFGKKGQGPGEFNGPIGISCVPGNEVMVEDALSQRLAFFDDTGKFLRNLSAAKALGLSGVKMDTLRNMIARVLSVEGTNMKFEVKAFDAELNPKKTFASVDFPNPLQGKIDIFGLMILYEMDRGGNVFLGSNQDYEIKVFNQEKALIKKIVKTYEPVPLTKEDREEFINRIPATAGINLKERIVFPKNFPAFQGFWPDEKGRLFVKTWEKGKKKKEFIYDVIDADGNYFAQIPMSLEPRVWRGDKLYAIEEDEEGYKSVKCFRFRWEK